MCPFCLEKIVDSTKTKTGQDAIFCAGGSMRCMVAQKVRRAL